MKVKAAVAWGPNQPLSIEEVDLEGPRKGEVLVKIILIAGQINSCKYLSI